MKKSIILLVTLILCGTLAKAQFSHLKDVKLQSAKDYTEYTEQIFDCSDYILLTPYDKKDKERTTAINFVTRWLEGSPEYSFFISDNIKVITEERDDLLGLYTTCYAKIIVENEGAITNHEKIENLAINSLLEYCGNQINKVKPTKEMKNLIVLKNNGELASLSSYFLSKKEAN
ncbi:hypothetical protein E9993_13975 [Labilibacter sediminis]|nr:hypothetical protein E9993_13975 [Labilibacter sediminis]